MDLKAEFVSQLPPDDRYELAWLKGEILTMASGYKALALTRVRMPSELAATEAGKQATKEIVEDLYRKRTGGDMCILDWVSDEEYFKSAGPLGYLPGGVLFLFSPKYAYNGAMNPAEIEWFQIKTKGDNFSEQRQSQEKAP